MTTMITTTRKGTDMAHIPTHEEALAAQDREKQIIARVRPIYAQYDRGLMTWEEFKDMVEDDISDLLPMPPT